MADNTLLNAGTGGDQIRDKDRAGVKTQIVGLDLNPAGAESLMAGSLPSYNPSAFITGAFTAVDTAVAVPDGAGMPLSGVSTPGSYIALAIPDGLSDWTLLITGYATGTVYSEASSDSTNGVNGNWVELKGRRAGTVPGVEPIAYSFTSNGYWRGNVGGFKYFRVRYLGTFTSGLNIRIDSSAGVAAVFLNSGMPSGTFVIGKVGIDQTTDGNTNKVQAFQQPLTKGVQGSLGVTTQDLKDAGRVAVTITGYQIAGTITTETITAGLVRQADGVAAASTNTFTVTAGKRFRIQNIFIEYKQSVAATSNMKVALRYVPFGGTLSNTSPVIVIGDIVSSNANVSMVAPLLFSMPDGFELPAGAIYGLYNLSSATTNLITFTLHGYEY